MKGSVKLENWMKFRPYVKLSKTDGYYMKVANKIYNILADDEFILELYYDDDEIKSLACFLVSYLEDIVSGTNIWNTFVRLHKEKYDKYLPFYYEEEYLINEVNVSDIKFLIWYFYVVDLVDDIDFFGEVDLIAEKIFAIIAEEYEYAPENEYLRSIYYLESKYYEFYDVRKVLQHLLYGSYLFSIDTGRRATELIEKELTDADYKNLEQLDFIINNFNDNFTHSLATSLLAMKSKEWLAEILGNNHFLYNELYNMSDKTTGYFFYKGQDEKYIYLEHIATEISINLLKSSFNFHQELKEDIIILIGIVKWCGEWWFSGIMSSFDYDEKFIQEIKNDPIYKNTNLNQEKNLKKSYEIINDQLEIFLEFNNNSKVAFLKKYEAQNFIKNFIKFYNHKIALKKNIDLNNSLDRKELIIDNKFSDDLIAFLNPKSGLQLAFGVNNVFPDEKNINFNPELSGEDFRFLINSELATELCYYVVENYKDKIPYFEEPEGILILENLDFLLKFFKRENYYTKPAVTLV